MSARDRFASKVAGISRFLGLIFFLTVASGANAQATLHVEVSGQVNHPGVLGLPAQARLRDAIDTVEVKHDAYVIGAAWFQSRLLVPQQRLKAGIVFELSTLIRPSPLTDNYSALSGTARAMLGWLRLLPVTGRAAAMRLDPDLLQISRQDNLLVGDGDRLFYPTRPSTVRVVGAVLQPCIFPQQALKDIHFYLAQCPRSGAADKDTAYLIQPDGKVLSLGIALWDRSAPMPMAPGAVLYVPIDHRIVDTLDDSKLNRDIADFLATQLADSWKVAP